MNKIPYSIFADQDLFVARADGSISFDDLYQHVLILMGDKEFKSGINALYDFSNLTDFTGELAKLEALVAGMSSEDVIVEKAKTAILLPNKFELNIHGVMEQYMAMTASSQIDYRIFMLAEFEQAADFLGYDSLFLEGLLNFAFK